MHLNRLDDGDRYVTRSTRTRGHAGQSTSGGGTVAEDSADED